eukprot:296576-Chlamydomonas_euryale.AAC.1
MTSPQAICGMAPTMCVKLGMAYSKRTFMGGTGSFFARRVQMPAGPLHAGTPMHVGSCLMPPGMRRCNSTAQHSAA